jgi:NAD+-dependent farnesol dehydrogenase
VRVLVTGGTGYLGRAVVQSLLGARHDVVVYARTATTTAMDLGTGAAVPGRAASEPSRWLDNARPLLPDRMPSVVTAVDGDVRDASRLTEAARGCQAIVHLAALVAVWRRDPREFDAVNVGGLQHVLDAARTCGVARVVYVSSFLALPPVPLERAPAWNDYQRTKASADAMAGTAVAAGAPLTRLYPGVIYGPGRLTEGNLVGRMISDHLAGRLPGVVGGGHIWSFAYVDDVAAACVAAVERGRTGEHYLLGGENAPQMRVFEIVRALTGRRLPRRLPGWLAAIGATADELRATWFGGTPLLTTGTLEILLRDWPLGSRLAQTDLGYRVTPLADGIRAIVQEWESHPQPTASA